MKKDRDASSGVVIEAITIDISRMKYSPSRKERLKQDQNFMKGTMNFL